MYFGGVQIPKETPELKKRIAALLLVAGLSLTLLAQESQPPSSQPAPLQPIQQPVPGPQPTPGEQPPVPPEEPSAPSQAEPAPVTTATATPPPSGTRPAATSDPFPNFNLYLPEGELDIRPRRMIKNVLFEAQVNYNFVDGDVSTFLRYKYYARDYTYKIGVFDTIEFDSVDSGSNDFDRVRGALLLFEYPVNYNSRYFLLFQDDGLSFGDVDKPDNNKMNLYTKLAYQFGTPFDERMNSIVGESRGRQTPVLTAYREIGPQKLGWAVALTQSFEGAGGDYSYTKFETEVLKRFDLSQTTFVVSRFHLGSMLAKGKRDDLPTDPDIVIRESDKFTVPRYELFKLGGRAAMKAVSDRVRGTDEWHLTGEYFVPVFRNKEYKTGIFYWNNLYGIGYLGAGALGLEFGDLVNEDRFAADGGLGFEVNFNARNYELFLTAVYAQTFQAPVDLEGSEVRVSVRTSR